MTVDPQPITKAADFIGESHLDRMEGVVDELEDLGLFQRDTVDSGVNSAVEQFNCVSGTTVKLTYHSVRRHLKISDRAGFTQKLRIAGQAEFAAGFAAGLLFQDREQTISGRAGESCRAQYDNVVMGDVLQSLADFDCYVTHILKHQIAVG